MELFGKSQPHFTFRLLLPRFNLPNFESSQSLRMTIAQTVFATNAGSEIKALR
jgi:hypothetical protein